MIWIESLDRIRITLKSGRQIDEWTSDWSIVAGGGGITSMRITHAYESPKLLGWDAREVAAVQLIGHRYRWRLGRRP